MTTAAAHAAIEGDIEVGNIAVGAQVLEYARVLHQGKRERMEDFAQVASFQEKESHGWLAIFDGHGGSRVAGICSRRVFEIFLDLRSANGESFGQTLEGAYKAADEELLDDTLLDCYVLSCPPLRRSSKSLFVGSTGVSVVVSPSTITVAHVGDSRALLVKQGQCEFVTTDHTLALDEEHKRVIAAGGEIRKGMLTAADYRCEYMARRFLTMTRALGDFGFKANSEKKASEQPVISVPDVARLERSNEDNFLIVASDGLWSVMKSEEVALFVYSRSEKGTTLQECCAQLLKECAVARRSADNISIIILSLNS